jgi:hypothetical protein
VATLEQVSIHISIYAGCFEFRSLRVRLHLTALWACDWVMYGHAVCCISRTCTTATYMGNCLVFTGVSLERSSRHQRCKTAFTADELHTASGVKPCNFTVWQQNAVQLQQLTQRMHISAAFLYVMDYLYDVPRSSAALKILSKLVCIPKSRRHAAYRMHLKQSDFKRLNWSPPASSSVFVCAGAPFFCLKIVCRFPLLAVR